MYKTITWYQLHFPNMYVFMFVCAHKKPEEQKTQIIILLFLGSRITDLFSVLFLYFPMYPKCTCVTFIIWNKFYFLKERSKSGLALLFCSSFWRKTFTKFPKGWYRKLFSWYQLCQLKTLLTELVCRPKGSLPILYGAHSQEATYSVLTFFVSSLFKGF